MTRADRLAISNSTFSFTAAMFSNAGSESQPVFYRPVPESRALVPFEPWDSKPLLTCSPGEMGELRAVGYT